MLLEGIFNISHFNEVIIIELCWIRCDPSILEMILDFKIDMDSRTKCGETALDIAVKYEFKDCARLLIKDQAKCNVNIQVQYIIVIIIHR